MASENEYARRIGHCDWTALLDLWESIQAENTRGWAPGKAFEYLVLRAFQLEGADIGWPYTVSIGGEQIEQIDGVVYSDGLSCLVECKDQRDPVNVEPIAKLRNQLLRRPSSAIGVVFSSRSAFSDPAVTLAQFTAPQTILLWRPEEVDCALRQQRVRQALTAKHRWCIEYGLPDYNITAGDLP